MSYAHSAAPPATCVRKHHSFWFIHEITRRFTSSLRMFAHNEHILFSRLFTYIKGLHRVGSRASFLWPPHVPAGAEVAAAAVFHHGEAGGRVRSTASPPPPRVARPQQQHPGGADGGGPSTSRSQPKAQRCAPRPAPAPRCLPACPSLPCRSCPLCPPSAQERAWGPRQLRRIPAHR